MRKRSLADAVLETNTMPATIRMHNQWRKMDEIFMA